MPFIVLILCGTQSGFDKSRTHVMRVIENISSYTVNQLVCSCRETFVPLCDTPHD